VSHAQAESPNLKESLDRATVALIELAAAVAVGDEADLAARSHQALAADVPTVWVDELLLQSILMVGWPRSLVAATVWRRESGHQAPLTDASQDENGDVWRRRGEHTCGVVYGDHYDRLRAHVHSLHPAMDRWMISDGYGKVLSRPGLDLLRREWCVIAQTAVLGAERQLRSHLRGASHAGGTDHQMRAVLAVVTPFLSESGQELLRATAAKVAVRPTGANR
jgi:4-carboxymuconolactone decarboxylase